MKASPDAHLGLSQHPRPLSQCDDTRVPCYCHFSVNPNPTPSLLLRQTVQRYCSMYLSNLYPRGISKRFVVGMECPARRTGAEGSSGRGEGVRPLRERTPSFHYMRTGGASSLVLYAPPSSFEDCVFLLIHGFIPFPLSDDTLSLWPCSTSRPVSTSGSGRCWASRNFGPPSTSCPASKRFPMTWGSAIIKIGAPRSNATAACYSKIGSLDLPPPPGLLSRRMRVAQEQSRHRPAPASGARHVTTSRPRSTRLTGYIQGLTKPMPLIPPGSPYLEPATISLVTRCRRAVGKPEIIIMIIIIITTCLHIMPRAIICISLTRSVPVVLCSLYVWLFYN